MQNLRVAVDVGGTFTDICIMDETTGLIRIEKTASYARTRSTASWPASPRPAIDLGKVALFSHGTTVATNALITRRLPRTAMVCTKGFRDVHRNPARQQGRPLGHLQGRGEALRAAHAIG